MAEQYATASCRPLHFRVHADPGELRQIDHEAVVTNRLSGPAMATTADSSKQVSFAGERDGVRHVGARETASDQGGALVMHAIPDSPGAIVVRTIGENHGPRKSLTQLPDGRPFQF